MYSYDNLFIFLYKFIYGYLRFSKAINLFLHLE